MEQIYKYPRTHHIQGSRSQPGDEDLDSIPNENVKLISHPVRVT
jgi:hypothetical protein